MSFHKKKINKRRVQQLLRNLKPVKEINKSQHGQKLNKMLRRKKRRRLTTY